MARIPFFESTWRRKARLTGIVLGVYAVARLLALLSEKLVGPGWSDIPVSALVLIYLAFLYVEVWIILERHTRPAFSILAALLLAGLCLTSPFIAFDPVASGSVPDRLRFWEPTRGIARAPGQRIAVLPQSYLDGPLQEAREALDRSEAGLLPTLGLVEGAGRLTAEEEAALPPGLEKLALAAGLPAPRARLFSAAAQLRLARARAETTAELAATRVGCLEQLASRTQPPPAPRSTTPPAPALPPTPPADRCGFLAPSELRLDGQAAAGLVEAAAGATSSFVEQVLERAGSWVEASREGRGPAGPVELAFRLSPAEPPASTYAAALDGPVTARQREQYGELAAQLDRYRSALQRHLRVQEELGLLLAQLELITRQVTGSLAAQRVLRDEQPPAWQVVPAERLNARLARSSQVELARLLDARPRDVLGHAEAIADPQQQERFLHYLSQTQHWHLRDPGKVKARLLQAEDEFRSAERLGAGDFPPVALCAAMAPEQLDAALLQLASLDRQGEKVLRLLLVQREPCMVVWDHDVPIYDHADMLASTQDDGRAMTEAASAFFTASPLGTDYLGKDMLMQLVKGTEGFFLPGLLAVAIGLGLGVLLGAFAGYMGGAVDKAITFCTTLVGSFPRLVFILLVCTIPESPSMTMIGGITGALFIPQVAEAVRRRVLALKAEDFIVASRAHGLSLPRVLFYHMVWLQCFPEIVRQAL
ncbi:MAG: ABC transporter permease subunit, partial [Deltaproteobacteria bacterium]|nr:ABC transporter permease subunit [Deltaproteobacteria bacterium]